MALHSLYCADVPLRNCPLTQHTGEFISLWSKWHSFISHSLSHSNYLLS